MVKVMLLSLPTEATTRSLCPLEEEILGKICFFFLGGCWGVFVFTFIILHACQCCVLGLQEQSSNGKKQPVRLCGFKVW